MKLQHVRISNYKCFLDTGKIPLGPRFTVLVGQNNAGKTAFLEALRAGVLENKPHRDPGDARLTLPKVINPLSTVEFGVSLRGTEILWRLLSSGSQIRLPVEGTSADHARAKVVELFGSEGISSTLRFAGGWQPAQMPLIPLSELRPDSWELYG